MKTEDLIINKTYKYKEKNVIFKGEKNEGITFFKFESEPDEAGKIILYSLYPYEVEELISEEKISKEVKLKILKLALEKIINDPLYNMCDLLRLLTQQETGQNFDKLEIQEIYNLNQFRPEGLVKMEAWFPLNRHGQVLRRACIESLIKDLEK